MGAGRFWWNGGVKQPKRYPSVVIGFLSSGLTDHMFTSSLCGSFIHQIETGEQCISGVISLISSPRIAYTRNDVILKFLQMKYQDPNTGSFSYPEALCFIDADMVWHGDAIHRLAEHLNKDNPIIAGLCFAGKPETGAFATAHRLTQKEDGTWDGGTELVPFHDLPEDSLVNIGATGAACLMIHRNALMGIAGANRFGTRTTPDGKRIQNETIWFEDRGGTWGEDIVFCVKAQSCGFPIKIHTGVEFGHRKTITMDADFWLDHKQIGSDEARHGLGPGQWGLA